MYSRMFDDEFNLINKAIDKIMWNKLISYNLEDQGSYYLIEFYTPGVKKEDLCLKMHNGRLSLVIEKDDSAQEIKVNGNLPQESAGNILAKYEDGVLTVTVPKNNHEARIIEIM